MTASRRLLIALVLLLALPVRALAAAGMACCPIEPAHTMPAADGHEASMDTDGHDDASGPSQAADVPHHAAPACCVAAIIAPSTSGVAVPPPFSIRTVEARFDPVAAFLTDAPERPPRLRLVSA